MFFHLIHPFSKVWQCSHQVCQARRRYCMFCLMVLLEFFQSSFIRSLWMSLGLNCISPCAANRKEGMHEMARKPHFPGIMQQPQHHVFDQVLCGALPVGYLKAVKANEWATFARVAVSTYHFRIIFVSFSEAFRQVRSFAVPCRAVPHTALRSCCRLPTKPL